MVAEFAPGSGDHPGHRSRYNDYEWFTQMTRDGVYFVTCMKTGSVYTVVEECEVPAKGNVRRDEIVSLPSLEKAGEDPILWQARGEMSVSEVADAFDVSPTTILAIFAARHSSHSVGSNSKIKLGPLSATQSLLHKSHLSSVPHYNHFTYLLQCPKYWVSSPSASALRHLLIIVSRTLMQQKLVASRVLKSFLRQNLKKC
ncbi:MAG: family transposase [Edaphobacter sp.]|nr:family transposase [Edaphobacter sp.]